MAHWFRYYDVLTTAGPRVRLARCPVLRETPKGVWLMGMQYGLENPRFVLRSATKRWACPTEEEALTAFMARKRRQIEIHTARLKRAKQALRLAEAIDPEIQGDAPDYPLFGGWEDD